MVCVLGISVGRDKDSAHTDTSYGQFYLLSLKDVARELGKRQILTAFHLFIYFSFCSLFP